VWRFVAGLTKFKEYGGRVIEKSALLIVVHHSFLYFFFSEAGTMKNAYEHSPILKPLVLFMHQPEEKFTALLWPRPIVLVKLSTVLAPTVAKPCSRLYCM
jgi:hypothetical protein